MDDKKSKKPLTMADVDASKYGNIIRESSPEVINTMEVLPQYKEGAKWAGDVEDALLNKKLKKVGSFVSEEAKDVGSKFADAARHLIKSGKKEAAKELLERARGAMFKNAAKWGMKSLPMIGGIAAAMYEGDASAAVPILDEADPLGPAPGSMEARMEDPSISEDQRMKIMEALKNKYKTQY